MNSTLKQRVREDFSKASESYDDAAIVQHEVCDRVLERLEVLKINPNMILDIGSGTGRSTKGLCKHFTSARVIACDIAFPMLHQSKIKLQNQGATHLCCDVEELPINDNSIDLIFSSSALQWCEDLQKAFSECQRVLNNKGVLIFSTFGPDTLIQLRKSWAEVDQKHHVHEFVDMHHIGDMLLTMGFKDPVMSMELLTIEYQTAQQLMQDLKATGSRSKFLNNSNHESTGLQGKHTFKKFLSAYEKYRQENGLLPASYEVIYGYVYKDDMQNKDTSTKEFSMPIENLKSPNN